MSMVVTDIRKTAYCHFYFQSVEELVAHFELLDPLEERSSYDLWKCRR